MFGKGASFSGFIENEWAPVLISGWGGPFGSATLDFLEHAFELKQNPGVGRTLCVQQRIKIPDRHRLFRPFAKEVHLLFPVVIDGADLRGNFGGQRTYFPAFDKFGQLAQLLRRELDGKAACLAVIPLFLITDAPIGIDGQVLGVGFIQQRSLDVIVGDQEWRGSVLGDDKKRQQKNYGKKSESHKQSLPQVIEMFSRLIKQGTDKKKGWRSSASLLVKG
jgi:hypothetical protein